MGVTGPIDPVAVGGGLGEPEGGAAGEHSRSFGRAVAATFLENRLAIVGLAVIVLMILFCFVGPLIWHTNQVSTNFGQANRAPGAGHPLGTDPSGYDVLGRLMVGGQSSLEIGFAVAVVATIIGASYGAIAGFAGGIVDALMMRIVDALLSIPSLVFLLILVRIVTPDVGFLILILGVQSWLITARLVRGEALTIRTRDFVAAARLVGARRTRIVYRHIIPNALGVIVVQSAFEVANAILAIANLSFLGLGLPPPHASWGGILSQGLEYLYDGNWWLVYPAGIAIVLTVVAFYSVGNALRDSLDVRLQRR